MLKDLILHRLFKPKNVPASDSPLLSLVTANQLARDADLIRLGTGYGGWHIPKAHGLGPESVCYLVGAGEDVSFDCALAEQTGARVRIIDPTPRAIAHFEALASAVRSGKRFAVNNSASDFYDINQAVLQRLSFHPYGVADEDAELKFFLPKDPTHVSCSVVNLQKTEDYFVAQCHRLSTLMKLLGDETVDLLKIDIEGAEYATIADIVASGLLPQIFLIEFDETFSSDQAARDRIANSIRVLEGAGMHCVSVDASNAVFVRNQ